MQTEEFVARVQHQVAEPLDHKRANAAVDASLQVLGEALSASEARDLAAQLPAELEAAVIRGATGDAPADAETFRQRVAEHADIPLAAAHAYADAALTVLREAVSEGEAINVALQVPTFVSELMAR